MLPVASGGLTAVNKITDTKIDGLTSGSSGLQYYDKDKQKFYKINENGEIEELSNTLFYQVETVSWSNNGEKAILEYPDGSNILYNFKTGKQVTLPREMEEFSFNSIGNQITAKWIGNYEEDNWIVAANDDGSGMFLVEALGDQSYSTDVGYSPDNQIAAVHHKAYGIDRQEIYPIGLHGENLKSFVVDGAGFTSAWSPEGSTLLYSVHNQATDYTPNLWVTQGKTSELGDLKVSLNVATWPEKCTFSGENTLFCAVPQGLPRGAGLFPEIADRYPDNFYHIDLNTGTKTLIASPVGESGSYTAYNLFTSDDGSILYFIDNNSGTLQSIRLK
ncbi:hypothetical protein K8R42_04450 [bacterium]|nr:hypothetical protein [bacterium]